MVRRLVGRQQLGQAEVGDLDVVRRLHQDVPRRQVSMHQVALLQVVHALQRPAGPVLSIGTGLRRCETIPET